MRKILVWSTVAVVTWTASGFVAGYALGQYQMRETMFAEMERAGATVNRETGDVYAPGIMPSH